MKNSKMKQLKQSEICRIKAAILEIMEDVNFIVNEDVKFEPAQEEEHYMMSFPKKATSVGELNNIQYELGDDFNVLVTAGDKKFLVVTIVAHEDAFIGKLGKKPQFLEKTVQEEKEESEEEHQTEQEDVQKDIDFEE